MLKRLLAVSALALITANCSHNEKKVVEPVASHGTVGAQGAREAGNLNVVRNPADIFKTPTQFVGRTVVVSGKINKILDNRAIQMKVGGHLGMGEKHLLIFNESGHAWPNLAKGDKISVRGPVQIFHRQDIEEHLGIDLNQDEFGDFENLPFIAATAIDMSRD